MPLSSFWKSPCFVLLLLALTAARSNAAVIKSDLIFATVGEQALALDLYLPEGKPKGVIVWIHGGAWRGGNRANPTLRALTDYGWAIASVDYRLSGTAPFPAQSHDIKAAIRYLRAHAVDLGIPTAPFIASGASAGGHLAAIVGVTNNSIPH